ncbi:MAG: 50S ribosomal protein L5 [Candidatus Magasanikbacteria bacterium]|nr:50S ribosomal protein L5 [Candidatus Magasanikbacteria bacterium]
MESRLYKKYKQEAAPALKERLGLRNVMQVPELTKVVLNVGYGRFVKETALIEVVEGTLKAISGQKPVHNKSRKSISNFKIREGMNIGASVTLRGKKMYDFVDKLISITLPRVRDFRGLSRKSFDQRGNYCVGFKEHNAFPEVKVESMEKLHGLEVVIGTSAKNKEAGMALLEQLGFPFKTKEKE